MGIGPTLGMIVSGAVAVYGVVLLSRDHPDAVEERRQAAQEAAEALAAAQTLGLVSDVGDEPDGSARDGQSGQSSPKA